MKARDRLSVVIPFGGRQRLPLLEATLAGLRRDPAADQIVIAEYGAEPCAREAATRHGADYLYTHATGPFDKARMFNLGSAAARHAALLWCDADMLFEPGFLGRALAEFHEGGFDFMFPFATIDYLDQAQSREVMAGRLALANCGSMQRLTPHPGGAPGGMGLVRAEFLRRHGGMIAGFRGWGNEDLAWLHKVGQLGRLGRTMDPGQRLWHLFHGDSGSHSATANQIALRRNPDYAHNLERLREIQAIADPAELARRFPPPRALAPWPDKARIVFALPADAPNGRAARLARSWAGRIEQAFGEAPLLVPARAEAVIEAMRWPGPRVAVAFAPDLAACSEIAGLAPGEPWLLVPLAAEGTLDGLVSSALVLVETASQAEAQGARVWHRPWSAADDHGLPVILQPLSLLLGLPRRWPVRIALERSALSPAALDRPPFWYVGCHDEHGAEIMRQDASLADLMPLFARNEQRIVIERDVVSVRPPVRWTVWTLDRHRRWLDNLSGPVEAP